MINLSSFSKSDMMLKYCTYLTTKNLGWSSRQTVLSQIVNFYGRIYLTSKTFQFTVLFFENL